MPDMNPTGKHRPKRRHHGEGSVVHRTDHYRAKPWAAIVPYFDASGRRREMWLSAASRAEADELRKAELARLRKGLRPTDQTVGEYVTAWLETVEVGPGTLPRYEAHLAVRIAPSIGSVALAALTPQMVRRAIIGWSGAPQTRAGALRLLRAAMNQAKADRRIEHDPTEGIPHPKVPRHEPASLTAVQARHLMATVKGEPFAPILTVSLGLGLRRGEALGLRTQDIIWEENDGEARMGQRDRDDDIAESSGVGGTPNARHGAAPSPVALHRNADGRPLRPVAVSIGHGLRYIPPKLRAEGEGPYRLTGTKTKESRVLPLPAFVAEALADSIELRAAERKAARIHAANDFVFAYPNGNSVPLETLYRWFKDALKRAGLPDIRWHDLRGSTATLLVESGVDLFTVQTILGHRDLATTRLYVGKTPATMRAAADRLDEVIG